MIPFLLDEQAYQLGFLRWLNIDYTKSPHVLWSGRTGSGKTVGAKLLLARSILLAPPELQPVEVTVIDPKADADFEFLTGLSTFYRGSDSPRGLDNVFEAFELRQNKEDNRRNLKIIFVDEFASLINLIEDKKAKEAAQRKLICSPPYTALRQPLQASTSQKSIMICTQCGRQHDGCYFILRGSFMPRKNKPKKLNAQQHYATTFSPRYKEKCCGCAFVGPDFECLTSDSI